MRTATELVKGAKQKRTLLDVLSGVEQTITAGGEQGEYSKVVDQLQNGLANLDHVEADDSAALWDNAFDRWEDEIDNPKTILTIPTPWEELNEILAGGLKSSRLYTWGARPGDGKSIAILNVAGHAAEQGYGVAVFSLELDEHEVMSRLIAAGARADYGQITRGHIDAENRAKIKAYREEMVGQNLTVIDKSRLTVDELGRQCRALKRTNGIDLIVVDYLQIMSADPRQPRLEQLRQISGGLKALAKELHVPVVTAAQLNRKAGEEGNRPNIRDLRESGSIEQDSDVVVMLHHELFEGRKETGEVELIVGKNRTGQQKTITEFWLPHRARIGK